MLKKLSLRMRLTLLSALVTAGAAVVLTSMFLLGADRIFVRDMAQKISYQSDGRAQPEELLLSYEVTPSGGAGEGSVVITLKKAKTQFNLWGLAGLALVLLLGTGATWLMAGSVLKPLGDLADTIEEIGGNDLSARAQGQERQDELGRLARLFNHMMDKVSASFERQKRFSASAAHELKTPLATIMVNLEVLELDGQPSPERMKRALTVVRAHTERMVRLVEDLFRLTSGEATGLREEAPLGEAFALAVEELSPLIRQKGLTVTVADMAGMKLTGSRAMINRAMANLVENAVKYNREGGSVSIAAQEQGGCLQVRVSDTGIGISGEDCRHIFEPFYRADRSRSRAVGGAGLGLPLVKDIVEKHGGRIEVESEPGRGTTFTLYFPSHKSGDADR